MSLFGWWFLRLLLMLICCERKTLFEWLKTSADSSTLLCLLHYIFCCFIMSILIAVFSFPERTSMSYMSWGLSCLLFANQYHLLFHTAYVHCSLHFNHCMVTNAVTLLFFIRFCPTQLENPIENVSLTNWRIHKSEALLHCSTRRWLRNVFSLCLVFQHVTFQPLCTLYR
jgi:hypothetical protein